MTEALLIVIALVVLASGVWVLCRPEAIPPPPADATWTEIVTHPPDLTPPQAPIQPHTIRVHLTAEDGRSLGTVRVEAKRRPVTLQVRTGRRLGNFVLSGRDGGSFVYRRVGVERE